MKKLTMYTLASASVLAAVVGNAFHTHQQFYPSMVSLSQSRLFNVLMTNTFAVFVIGAFELTRFIFLGALRDQEVEKVMENTAFFLMELFLALTVFGERYTIKTVAMFVMCICWEVFHWLAQSRLEFIEQTPALGTGQARLAVFLTVLILVDSAVGQGLAEDMLTNGPSVKLLLLEEFLVMGVLATSALLRLVLHIVDARRNRRWEHKGAARFYLEILSDALQSIIYSAFFFVIYAYYGLPMNLIRKMFVTTRNLYRTVRNFLNYRRLAANLDSKFPNATDEDILQDPTCSICYDDMLTGEAKRLHCSHVFHRHCLRQWLERHSTCPYCRQQIDSDPNSANLRARAAREAAEAARGADAPAVDGDGNEAAGGAGGGADADGGAATPARAGAGAGAVSDDEEGEERSPSQPHSASTEDTKSGSSDAEKKLRRKEGKAGKNALNAEIHDAYQRYLKGLGKWGGNGSDGAAAGPTGTSSAPAAAAASSSSSSSAAGRPPVALSQLIQLAEARRQTQQAPQADRDAGSMAAAVYAVFGNPTSASVPVSAPQGASASAAALPYAPSRAEANAYKQFHLDMANAYGSLSDALGDAQREQKDTTTASPKAHSSQDAATDEQADSSPTAEDGVVV